MTRSQQRIRVQLEEVQAQFLEEYGWRREGKRWVHQHVSGGHVPYPARDAVAQTYANPLLAMGGRL